MLDELTRRSIVPREFRGLVIEAIKIRNFLVHRYWGDHARVKCLGTPAGRSWLIGDLNRIRGALMHTNRQVDAVIDSDLKEYGSSLSASSDPEWEKYESGSEPPPELLN
jgi:hypothetical protein